MSTHQGVRVTSSTAGTPTPGYAHLFKPYRRLGNPGWRDDDPSTWEENAVPERPAVTPERARRLAEFAGLRAQGLSIPEAGRRMGVKEKTAYAYERDWRHLRRQQGATS